MVQYRRIKMCEECDHVVPSAYRKNKYITQLLNSLKRNCPVEFVYIFPADQDDHQRWIGGIIRSNDILSDINLHNHPVKHSFKSQITN
jgi:hypothetical protein